MVRAFGLADFVWLLWRMANADPNADGIASHLIASRLAWLHASGYKVVCEGGSSGGLSTRCVSTQNCQSHTEMALLANLGHGVLLMCQTIVTRFESEKFQKV